MTARKMLGVQPNDLVLVDGGDVVGPEEGGAFRVAHTISDGAKTVAAVMQGVPTEVELARLSYADESRLGEEEPPPDERVYRARIVQVIDATDLLLRFDLGFGVRVDQRVRIAGVEAVFSQGDGGRAARQWARRWIAGTGNDLLVRTHKFQRSKVSTEYLADVWGRHNGEDFAAALVSAGHAKPWGPPPGSKP